jgi:hypothetical protein
MPTATKAVPHSPFADHLIRVHREATAAAPKGKPSS